MFTSLLIRDIAGPAGSSDNKRLVGDNEYEVPFHECPNDILRS